MLRMDSGRCVRTQDAEAPSTLLAQAAVLIARGEPVCIGLFGEVLCSEGVTKCAEAFLGPELRMGHVHLWCSRGQYDTGWHRDLGPAKDNTYEDEMALLNRPMAGLRYQVALVDDPCLWLVPGSQRRYRTPEEREALAVDTKRDISTQVNVPLKRGQTLLWSGNTVHRGRKPPELDERLSMTIGLFRYDPAEPKMAMDERFRWKLAANIRDSLPPKAQLSTMTAGGRCSRSRRDGH